MLARVTNYGRTRGFPTSCGNISMPYGRPIEITDPQTARELDAFPLISLEILEGSLDGKDVVEYADYTINELRSIAKQLGIEKGFFMKKSELIKKLEEHYDS